MHRNPPATQPAYRVETLASGVVRTWAIRYTLYLPHIIWSIIICHHTPMIFYVFCCSIIFPRKNLWYPMVSNKDIPKLKGWTGTTHCRAPLRTPQTTTSKTRAVGRASVNQGRSDEFSSIRWSVARSSWVIFEFMNLHMFNVYPDDLLRSPMFINLQHSHPGPMSVKFQRSVPRFQAKEMAPSPMVSTPPALAKWRNSGHRCVPKVEDIAAYNKEAHNIHIYICIYVCTKGNRFFPSARSQNVILTFSPSVYYNML